MVSKLALAALLSAVVSFAGAQDYPKGPVTIVVPYTAGGSVDMVAREMGKALGDRLKQTFVVENKPGASANIGAAYVAGAAPDGHTLLMSAATTMAVAPSLFKNLNYDPLTDLVPVALVTSQPNILVVHPGVKAKTADELIALARKKPGGLNLGIAAVGGPAHMAGELFMLKTGTKFTLVPYKGGKDTVMDLLGGRLDAIFAPFPEAIEHVKSGKLRPLAVTTKGRTQLLPEVASLNEAGLDDYELIGWMGLAAPKGTPKEVIDRLNAAVQDVLKDPGLKQRLNNMGLEPLSGSAEEFAAFRDSEVKKYRELIEVSGTKPL